MSAGHSEATGSTMYQVDLQGEWGEIWPSVDEVLVALEDHGVVGVERLRVMASEDDLTFLADAAEGSVAVKIALTERGHVQLQATLLDHVSGSEWTVPVPSVLRRVSDKCLTSQLGSASMLVTAFCDGVPLESVEPTADLVDALARTQGDLLASLADLDASVPSTNLWSIASFPDTYDALHSELPGDLAPTVARLRREWDDAIAPALAASPVQVLHADLNLSNVLVAGETISGVLDFGDAIRAPRVLDVAVTACYLGLAMHDLDHPLVHRFMNRIVDAGALTRAEARAVPALAACRAAMVLMLGRSSARTSRHPDYALRYDAHAAAALARLADRTSAYAGATAPTHPIQTSDERTPVQQVDAPSEAPATENTMINRFDPASTAGMSAEDAALLARRRRVLGDIYPLFYSKPVHVVRGEGARLYDNEGREYLDAYNNVLAVGHANPRIADAVDAQLRKMNTHTRYLQDGVVDYAERFVATHPEALDRVIFTNSGSEANDLALAIARWRTGAQGVIVTHNAYHGTTQVLAGVSPENGVAMPLHPYVRTVDAPDTYRYGDQAGAVFAASVREAIADLQRHGWGVSALLLDTIMSTDGIFAGEPGMLREGFRAVQEAGGLVIADEVQPGVGRLGESMWGFQRHTDDVDMATCGKPLAGGLPIGTLALSSELSDGYASSHRYFNTFGGNPASIAAAGAVLDEVEDRGLIASAHAVGEALAQGIRDASAPHGWVKDVRGAGLFIGVEMGADGDVPGSSLAAAVVNGLRERRVLISAVADDGRVLKVRPPLVFTHDDVALFLHHYSEVLSEIETKGVQR
ncbi:aminotransferase class III-fold pyridoxal phosphate-dependent enzyme [Demequina zhanjiangensis]|uniref:Aminotransferase class III-fold pyridoxal phosphate-dependent enzyme n=1 Tax=Demequina zhanjiangensis TaxID=3051659 RepID=A0ABT8G0D2_9MICO|nr:aminotransferase class III-fold pyridoxal phosphate-dependent enzyme [Demequina sp. SYSU T00b26]MDN4472604.1 aminotransferase class III-fold pyridoxal phosphate-dependent enzyme [Demequina sp. SYSU T00b26]